VRSGDSARDRRDLVALILEEEAVVVVVGLPLSLDGSHGPAAAAAVAEAEELRVLLAQHGTDVVLFDERLTTVTAHQALAASGTREHKRRNIVDQTAAAVMLSAWLDSSRRDS
jgi:putative Holliday junction resolvase